MKKRTKKKRLKEERYNQLLSKLPVETQKELSEGKYVVLLADASIQLDEDEHVRGRVIIQMHSGKKHADVKLLKIVQPN
mgnify:CR=1 FL=1